MSEASVENTILEDGAILPVILDGFFFTVINKSENKILAKCNNCLTNSSYSGSITSTSNFLRHLQVIVIKV